MMRLLHSDFPLDIVGKPQNLFKITTVIRTTRKVNTSWTISIKYSQPPVNILSGAFVEHPTKPGKHCYFQQYLLIKIHYSYFLFKIFATPCISSDNDAIAC